MKNEDMFFYEVPVLALIDLPMVKGGNPDESRPMGPVEEEEPGNPDW